MTACFMASTLASGSLPSSASLISDWDGDWPAWCTTIVQERSTAFAMAAAPHPRLGS